MNKIELFQSLSTLSVASIADADKTIRVMSSEIRPVNPRQKIVGTARTVSCHNDFLTVIGALSQSRAGDVLVVDSRESTRALVGELFSTEAQRRGLAGIIVDGPVRDLGALYKLEIPVYARSYCPCSGTTKKMMETQTEIRCGGINVVPEEIVFGDEDGIIVASVSQLIDLIPLAIQIQKTEEVIVGKIREGECLIDMLNFEEHVESLARGVESSLSFKI
jgi:4-hydroxy-4-methyl-2-oxoglutarate aldolase